MFINSLHHKVAVRI